MKIINYLLPIILLLNTCSAFRVKSTSKIRSSLRGNDPSAILAQNQRLDSTNGEYFLKMQDDGNLVAYSVKVKNGQSTDHAIWASNTNNKGNKPYQAIMQDDGNLVVYSDNKTSSDFSLWASNTNNKGEKPFRLSMQDDGNVVLYDSKNLVLWKSDTMGKK